jgi:hypothetical protein
MAGTVGIQDALVVSFTSSAGGAANNDYTLSRGGTIVESWCIARAASLAGTFQLSRVRSGVAGAITDAMNAAVDRVVTYQGTIDDDFYAVVSGDILRFQTVGATTRVDACATLVAPVANSTVVV